ncbi:MAG: hypothetical protein GF334_07765 [Candidatus Altiarchaeales archaeon]|nr:hypothetical protein [Candidatus Altiarchaeales archaeon]
MPPLSFSNQSLKQVKGHLKKHLNGRVKYRMRTYDDLVSLFETNRRPKSDKRSLIKRLNKSLDECARFNLEIGPFKSSAKIRQTNRKPRSQRGRDKDERRREVEKMSIGQRRKQGSRKNTRPKIRSQKAGRRTVTLKGQPGC